MVKLIVVEYCYSCITVRLTICVLFLKYFRIFNHFLNISTDEVFYGCSLSVGIQAFLFSWLLAKRGEAEFLLHLSESAALPQTPDIPGVKSELRLFSGGGVTTSQSPS